MVLFVIGASFAFGAALRFAAADRLVMFRSPRTGSEAVNSGIGMRVDATIEPGAPPR